MLFLGDPLWFRRGATNSGGLFAPIFLLLPFSFLKATKRIFASIPIAGRTQQFCYIKNPFSV